MKKYFAMDLQRFAMKNEDDKIKNEIELKEEMKAAIESGDSEAFAKVQIEMAKSIENRILQEAKTAINEDMVAPHAVAWIEIS